MTRVEIIPANVRDVSYILANLCEADRAEIACQYPEHTDTLTIGRSHLGLGAWCALLDSQPVQAFGLYPATPAGNVLIAWAFGTRFRRRSIPAVTRWMRERLLAAFAGGVTRVEARAIATHVGAGRWLRGLGAAEVPLRGFGRNGEDFILFSWVAE